MTETAAGAGLRMNNSFQFPATNDYSGVDSRAKAEELLLSGHLEKLLMLPPELGGLDHAQNVLYVPLSFASMKARIDARFVLPLFEKGEVTQYFARPEYEGNSFVPISITIEALNPGKFTTVMNIWGEALTRAAPE